MAVTAYAVMTCDGPGCDAALRDLPAAGALGLARWQHRWRRVGQPMGLPIDLCPDCFERYERDAALAKVAARQAARAGLVERMRG
jgi:hypothetical protein